MTGFPTWVLWRKEYETRADAKYIEDACKDRFESQRHFDSEWYTGITLRQIKSFVNGFDSFQGRELKFARHVVEVVIVVGVIFGISYYLATTPHLADTVERVETVLSDW